jgi:protein SCO1
MTSLQRLLAISVLSLGTLLAGCEQSKPVFNSVDITGANYARDFSLTDASGKKRSLGEFRGKVVAVFFGFAQCPDVCPTTLSDFAQIKEKLGADGERLQVIFITVDPQRDTPAILGSYVASFDPSFVGLTGSVDEINATAREFKVFYQKVAGKTEMSYTIDHTAGSYVFDKDGRVRLFVKHAAGVEAIAADLKQLL